MCTGEFGVLFSFVFILSFPLFKKEWRDTTGPELGHLDTIKGFFLFCSVFLLGGIYRQNSWWVLGAYIHDQVVYLCIVLILSIGSPEETMMLYICR